ASKQWQLLLPLIHRQRQTAKPLDVLCGKPVLPRTREQQSEVSPRRFAPHDAASGVISERADARPAHLAHLDVEPTIRSELNPLGLIETLRFTVSQEIERAPHLVAIARRDVRDAARAGPDRKIEAQLEVLEHGHARVERPHAPPAEEGAGVEIAAVGEVPER